MPPFATRLRGRYRRLLALPALLVIWAGVYAFLGVGRFLSREDALAQADAIFVLAGTTVERPLEAADLYLAGHAPVVVISRDTSEHEAAELERRRVTLPSRLDLTRELLRQLNVPDHAVLVSDRIHDNTAEEAETLRQLAASHGWRRVIVVSSKYHLRRAGMACRRYVYGMDVQIVMRGSRYDVSVPGTWWRTRHDIRWVVSEITKYAAYLVGIGMWTPDSCVRANVAGTRPLLRRLLVEHDALPFVELLERAGLHRAPVKEPLLTAVIPDEAKSAIPYQSLDRAVRHVEYLRGSRPHDPALNQFKFRSANH